MHSCGCPPRSRRSASRPASLPTAARWPCRRPTQRWRPSPTLAGHPGGADTNTAECAGRCRAGRCRAGRCCAAPRGALGRSRAISNLLSRPGQLHAAASKRAALLAAGAGSPPTPAAAGPLCPAGAATAAAGVLGLSSTPSRPGPGQPTQHIAQLGADAIPARRPPAGGWGAAGRPPAGWRPLCKQGPRVAAAAAVQESVCKHD